MQPYFDVVISEVLGQHRGLHMLLAALRSSSADPPYLGHYPGSVLVRRGWLQARSQVCMQDQTIIASSLLLELMLIFPWQTRGAGPRVGCACDVVSIVDGLLKDLAS